MMLLVWFVEKEADGLERAWVEEWFLVAKGADEVGRVQVEERRGEVLMGCVLMCGD
jgi:hypothetical protein